MSNDTESPAGTLAVNGEALRRNRLEQALTQDELAKAAGLDRITVSRLENGKPASPRSVRLIAAALGLAPKALTVVKALALVLAVVGIADGTEIA